MHWRRNERWQRLHFRHRRTGDRRRFKRRLRLSLQWGLRHPFTLIGPLNSHRAVGTGTAIATEITAIVAAMFWPIIRPMFRTMIRALVWPTIRPLIWPIVAARLKRALVGATIVAAILMLRTIVTIIAIAEAIVLLTIPPKWPVVAAILAFGVAIVIAVTLVTVVLPIVPVVRAIILSIRLALLRVLRRRDVALGIAALSVAGAHGSGLRAATKIFGAFVATLVFAHVVGEIKAIGA